MKKNVRVAVKCFWENRKGSRDDIFSEPPGKMPFEVEPEALEHAPNWYQLLYSCTRADPAKRFESVDALISRLKAIEVASDTKKKEQAELAERQAEAERLEKRRQLEKVQREEAQYGKRFQFEEEVASVGWVA